MCNTCCKECHGWCRAFTATELLLSILEAVLLILFIVFLTFIILHLIVCSYNEKGSSQILSEPEENISVSEPVQSSQAMQTRTTLSPNVQCTWTPSKKTKATSQYFEFNDKLVGDTTVLTNMQNPINDKFLPLSSDDDNQFDPDQTDGDTADKNGFVLSLVKITRSNDIIYGCILTIISEYWTVTAASCIKSIEQGNSLDSFVMIDNIEGSKDSRTHVVSQVVIHPLYKGINKIYDIIALRSADKISSSRNILQLPSMIDYLLITIGERLLIIGFGKFRSRTSKDLPLGSVFEAAVHVLPTSQCQSDRPRDGNVSLCVGPLYARGVACNYCAGTPLLQGSTLLGIMSDNKFCGVSCEPALYVNLAVVSDWLNAVMEDN